MATDNINPNYPGLDAALPAGQRITTRTSTFLASASAGAIIAVLVDPFGSGSSYATVGVVPGQLALSGSNIVRGSAVAVPGADYRIKVLATSADGLRDTSSILTFGAASTASGVTPTPSPAPTLTFAATTAAVAEGNSGTTVVANTVNVVRNGASGALVVNLSTAGTATAGVDYVALPATVTIPDGASSVSFNLPINGDTAVEPDETIAITAALAGYPATVPATKTITVLNDDVVAPLAPTVTATSGNGQALLSMADQSGSVGVQKYGVYRSASSGGTKTFLAWAYSKSQLWRRTLANGSSEFFAVTAWNTAGESPLSAEVSATASASAFNPLRIMGTVLFHSTLFYEIVGADFRAGSTIAVTASDGTALSTKIQNNAVLVYGTFPATGGDRDVTLTFSETPAGGGTPNLSTQVIRVVARPAVATYVTAKPTAQAVKARMNAKPIYVDAAIVATDMGTSIPSGYTGNFAVEFAGKSPPAGSYAVLGGLNPQPTYIGVRGYDPVERKVFQPFYIGYSTNNNTVLRFRLYRRTFVFAAQDTGDIAVHWKPRYSDDGMATWNELADPLYTRVGTRFWKLDPGVDAPATGRIWELEASSYAQFANFSYAPGFGFEAGETPQAVVDDSPIVSTYIDSFAHGIGATDMVKNAARTAARRLGFLNLWNQGINGHKYTFPATADFPLGLNRIGDNVMGIGDVSNPPRNDVILETVTINDFGQNDFVQAQAMHVNLLLRTRRLQPTAMIVHSLGFWAPQNRIPADYYTAIKAAFADASGNGADKAMRLNDGIVDGWAVAAGATGSSPYFFATNGGTVTGSSAGRVLTVTAGSGVEIGMYVWSGPTTTAANYTRARVIKQIDGTPGGVGTYLMDTTPRSGDFASGATVTLNSEDYATAYPVHPNPAGQTWMGQRLAAGVEALVNDIVANAP